MTALTQNKLAAAIVYAIGIAAGFAGVGLFALAFRFSNAFGSMAIYAIGGSWVIRLGYHIERSAIAKWKEAQ